MPLLRRRALIFLLLPIALCLALPNAWAESTTVRLLLGKREIPISPSAVFDGRRVLAPVALLDQLKLSYGAATGGRSLTVIGANGSPSDVDVVDVNGTRMVVVDQVLKLVGGEITTDPTARTSVMKAHLKSVEFADNTLRINCSLPVTCAVKRWQDKLIVDVPDSRLVSDAREVHVGGDVVTKVRLGQYDADTARVVLDTLKETGYQVTSDLPAAQLVIKLGEGLKSTPMTSQPAATTATTAPPPPKQQPFTVNAIRVEPVDERSFKLVLETSCKGAVSLSQSTGAAELTLVMKGATLADSVKGASGADKLLKEVRLAQVSTNPALARVHMNLNRVMLPKSEVQDGAITITMSLPEKAGGTLADKLIVIDPGHGGNQCGARFPQSGPECVKEKDVNLKLANELASALSALGVRTILTRQTDVTLGLSPRPAVAVQNNADFFISLHCNSNPRPNSQSGIETYCYRDGGVSPALLANAVQDAICRSTGMRDGKARTAGYVVLKELAGTGIPGILVECGYLNHSTDRAKLLDPGYRKKLAAGIVAGLKEYVEGTPTQ